MVPVQGVIRGCLLINLLLLILVLISIVCFWLSIWNGSSKMRSERMGVPGYKFCKRLRLSGPNFYMKPHFYVSLWWLLLEKRSTFSEFLLLSNNVDILVKTSHLISFGIVLCFHNGMHTNNIFFQDAFFLNNSLYFG